MHERCTIAGTIAGVVYQNEENGYTVLRLVTSDGEAVTVVGSIPCAAPGEELSPTPSRSLLWNIWQRPGNCRTDISGAKRGVLRLSPFRRRKSGKTLRGSLTK